MPSQETTRPGYSDPRSSYRTGYRTVKPGEDKGKDRGPEIYIAFRSRLGISAGDDEQSVRRRSRQPTVVRDIARSTCPRTGGPANKSTITRATPTRCLDGNSKFYAPLTGVRSRKVSPSGRCRIPRTNTPAVRPRLNWRASVSRPSPGGSGGGWGGGGAPNAAAPRPSGSMGFWLAPGLPLSEDNFEPLSLNPGESEQI